MVKKVVFSDLDGSLLDEKTYKFDNVIKGMRQYLSNMSGGKILFVP